MLFVLFFWMEFGRRPHRKFDVCGTGCAQKHFQHLKMQCVARAQNHASSRPCARDSVGVHEHVEMKIIILKDRILLWLLHLI